MSFSNTRLGSRSRRLRATAWASSTPPRRRAPRLDTPAVRPTVPDVVATNRLMSHLERNRREGGQAPGIDGVRYFELGLQEAGRALKEVRRAVLDRTYVAPPALPVDIPKKDRTFRRLMLDVTTKRALAASVREALLPAFWPRLSPLTYSVGGPVSSVPALLAELAAAFEFGGYGVLLNLDVRRSRRSRSTA